MVTVPHPYSGDDCLSEAYRMGWDHGHGVACHNVPKVGDHIRPWVDTTGLGKFVTVKNVREYHELLCHAACDNARQFSPFELIANTFNNPAGFTGKPEEDCEFVTEELWEAFEQGMADAIAADLAGYTDEDYGITVED